MMNENTMNEDLEQVVAFDYFMEGLKEAYKQGYYYGKNGRGVMYGVMYNQRSNFPTQEKKKAWEVGRDRGVEQHIKDAEEG